MCHLLLVGTQIDRPILELTGISMSHNSEAKKKRLIIINVNNNFYIENKTKHNTKWKKRQKLGKIFVAHETESVFL